MDSRYFLTLKRGSILAFGDLRISTRLGSHRSAAHAAGLRRSVDGGGSDPHEWHTWIGILCLCCFVDTRQPCDADRIPDENRRSRRGRPGSVVSCVRRRECGSPRAVGDTRSGLGSDGGWRVVVGRAACRLAAHPHSEAAGVTALLERFFPFHFRGMFTMPAPVQNREGSQIAHARRYFPF
jgi:hypothetical protein